MEFDNNVWEFEKRRLDMVTEVISEKLEKAKNFEADLRSKVISLQRSMWDSVNPTPGHSDLDDLANIWQYQTDIEKEGRKALFEASMVNKLKKMLNSPYFGRMDFREDGSDEIEMMYIGIGNLLKDKTHESLVYDWRAPVAGMFYDYETGRAEYKCPAGNIKGEILLKRQYRIWQGKIDSMFDCSLKIDDEILQEILSKSADNRMKVIVTSIQREQNRIIRDDVHRLLLVQGPAGSGKTSVALHRIAFLLYRYRNQMLADNIVIFSPNDVFNDYISTVLPELGEENMHRTTFMDYSRRMQGGNLKLEDMGNQMEYILTQKEKPYYKKRIEGIKFKASADFVKILKKYASYIEANYTFENIEHKGVVIESAEEIYDYFINGLKFLPVEKRLEKIRNRLISKLDPFIKERVEELSSELAESGDFVDKAEIRGRSTFIARGELQPLREKIENMTVLDPVDCYVRLFNDRDLMGQLNEGVIPEYYDDMGWYIKESIAAGKVSFEDVGPMMLLKGLLCGTPNMDGIKHVIIDEVQDYTPVQFEIIKQLFGHCSMTMLGDINQSINPYMNSGGYDTVLDIFKFDSSLALNLTKSYRSTRQITEFCRMLLPGKDVSEYMNRDGELPGVIKLDNEKELTDKLVYDIKQLKNAGCRSFAIICRSAEDSGNLQKKLESKMETRLVKNDTTEFVAEDVVSILPSYLAKGLEFDAVLVVCAEKDYDCEEERRLFYTCCTRALHRLNIYASGKLPQFVDDVDSRLYQKM